jgi:sugar transferase (PEP-CTERM/EpsH1 system associated)
MSETAPPARTKIGLMHVVHTLMVGGMERLVVDLLKGLSPDRYDRHVCCLDQRGPLADELQGYGVTVHCLNKGAGVRWDLPWKVRCLVRRLNIAVVHTHNLSGLLYGGVGATLAGVKVIVHTEHGRDLDYYHSRRSQRLERVLTRLANRIVSVSRPIYDEFRYGQGIPLRRLLLIGNGVQIERYEAAPAPDLRARLGIAEGDRVIGIVARLVPVKDHVTMLRAMVAVIQAIPEARLMVVGSGPLCGELETQAAQLGIASRVTFLGNRLNVPALLGLMEVFALSSVSEGMSMTILEAMAARCPVVATDVGGTSWVVHHEKTGLLVPSQQPDRLADAIVRLMTDRVLAAQLGQAGYNLVRERFQLDQVVQQYDDLYRQLLGARA